MDSGEHHLNRNLDSALEPVNIEKEKAAALKAIAELKSKKPDGWKRSTRILLNRLAYLDDPYGEHECHGTEQRGRHIHRTDGCPSFDNHGDNAYP